MNKIHLILLLLMLMSAAAYSQTVDHIAQNDAAQPAGISNDAVKASGDTFPGDANADPKAKAAASPQGTGANAKPDSPSVPLSPKETDINTMPNPASAPSNPEGTGTGVDTTPGPNGEPYSPAR